ncbi:hypothetical protein F0M16_22455 [Vibrio cholerae]|uniref:Uncharacterized protein n=2 Tax=Vibrio cholerae TaxID=666 RepID=A0A5Q6PD09_VIBCL|nr:hypothetical protein F0M16_22455 [Vibrio cholerae]
MLCLSLVVMRCQPLRRALCEQGDKMDNQILFELNDGAFWLSIIIGLFGLVIIIGVVWFGREIFTHTLSKHFCCSDCFEVLIHKYQHHNVSSELQAIMDSCADFRERRNEFWSVYGQIVLAIFIVVILAILLITKTISAEAGLPILSAVSGFAIAKGINSGKSRTNPINPADNEPKG